MVDGAKIGNGILFWHFLAFSSKILSLLQLLQLATAGLHIIGHCCSEAAFLVLAEMLFNLTEFSFCYVESYLVFDMLCTCILHNCVVYYVRCALFAVALQMLL